MQTAQLPITMIIILSAVYHVQSLVKLARAIHLMLAPAVFLAILLSALYVGQTALNSITPTAHLAFLAKVLV